MIGTATPSGLQIASMASGPHAPSAAGDMPRRLRHCSEIRDEGGSSPPYIKGMSPYEYAQGSFSIGSTKKLFGSIKGLLLLKDPLEEAAH